MKPAFKYDAAKNVKVYAIIDKDCPYIRGKIIAIWTGKYYVATVYNFADDIAKHAYTETTYKTITLDGAIAGCKYRGIWLGEQGYHDWKTTLRYYGYEYMTLLG